MTNLNQPPVWLLDVDGVVNARRPGWGADPGTGFATADRREWPMIWAPALLDRIRELHNAGTVEVRWSTTWCAFADQLERLWDLPVLGRAFTDPINGHLASMAKLAAARQVLDDGRRLIWTDDVEVPCRSDPLYAELTADGRALLIRPDGRHGLQPDDLDAIEAFAAHRPVETTRSGVPIRRLRCTSPAAAETFAALLATTHRLVIVDAEGDQVVFPHALGRVVIEVAELGKYLGFATDEESSLLMVSLAGDSV